MKNVITIILLIGLVIFYMIASGDEETTDIDTTAQWL